MSESLEFGFTIPHICGKEFRSRAIEWPPKIIFCPHCHQALVLHHYDQETGVVSYLSREYPDDH
jgi:hypothetical protein